MVSINERCQVAVSNEERIKFFLFIVFKSYNLRLIIKIKKILQKERRVIFISILCQIKL